MKQKEERHMGGNRGIKKSETNYMKAKKVRWEKIEKKQD